MAINFNQYPYNDDYLNGVDANTGISIHTKNFHRILFKPGVAVQARELTQSQSILQDQIKKFGDHIFKNHTQVYGAELTHNLSVRYIKLQEFDINNQGIVLANFLGKTITNSDGNIEAKVLHYIEGTPGIIVVTYFGSGEFDSNETIYVKGYEYTARVMDGDSKENTGPSSICSINDGVFYIDGYFVNVYKQTIALDEFSGSPTARIGLSIEESFISSDEDSSLLDPALGASNFQAPGADRYKIILKLVKKPLAIDDDTTFVELVRIYEGKILRSAMYTEYSEIDKYFARRTSETNGDFIVNKFNISITDNFANSNNFFVSIGPGKAYVNGFVVDNQSDKTFDVPKPRTTVEVLNNPIFVNYGNILYLNNLRGNIDIDSFQKVDFHCANTVNFSALTNYNSTLAGTARIKSFKFISAQNLSAISTYIYETYLVDIESKEFKGIASSYTLGNSATSTPGTITFPSNFSNLAGAYTGVRLRINNGNDSGDIFTITSYTSARVATLSADFINDPQAGFEFSLLFEPKDFECLYSANTSGGMSTNNCFALINSMSKIPANESGDVSLRNLNSDSGLIYAVGDDYVVQNSIKNVEYYSWMKFRSVNKETNYYLPENTFKFMISDGIIDTIDAAENFIVVNNSSNNVVAFDVAKGNTIQITDYVNSPSSFKLFSTSESGSFDVYARVKVSDTNYSNLTRRTKTLVTGNTSVLSAFSTLVTGKSNTYFDSARGQVKIKKADQTSERLSLYVSDVKQIIKIIDTRGSTSNNVLTDLSYDVTRNFDFNSGQTDNYYGHASIKQILNTPKIDGDLIVIFDYYNHGGNGYLDNKSYLDGGESYENIPFYVNSRGTRYELRDCIDFRPARTNSTNTFSFVGGVDRPIKIPLDSTSFESDYSYYLGRKDLIVIGKDNDFKIIQGTPGKTPIEPSQPDGSMILAKVELDPYVLRVTSDNRGSLYSNIRIKTMIHKRWKMEDITSLEERVSRVEYYTALNTLEIAALKTQIPDETGLNRFKNGILTDDFSSLLVADLEKEDYLASVQNIKTRLYATHNVKNYDLTIKDAIGTLGRYNPTSLTALDYAVNYDGDDAYLTLPYGTVWAATQPLASDVINVNPFNVIVVDGDISLSPKFDAWVSNTKLPDVKYTLPVVQSNSINSLNSGNFQAISGAQASTANGTLSIKGDVQNFDGWVTDASINPWIREQQITFAAKGMLSNTLVYCYFDGVDVTDRVRETNTLVIDSANSSFFNTGDLISTTATASATVFPVGKIIDAVSRRYTATDGTTRYTTECEIVGDIHIDRYTDVGSNTIHSVFVNQGGSIASGKGSGEIISIKRNSGRVLGLVPGTSNTKAVIRRFYPEEANTILDGSIFYIMDETNFDVNQNVIKTATEDASNNIIIIECEETIAGLEGYSFYTSGGTLTQTDKRKIYNIKPGNRIKTNSRGSVGGIFYLPKDTFHTGDRTFRIDNRIAENPGTETTYSETVFFASNLSYDKRDIIIDIPTPPPPPPPPVPPPAPPPEPPPPGPPAPPPPTPVCTYSSYDGHWLPPLPPSPPKKSRICRPAGPSPAPPAPPAPPVYISGWRLRRSGSVAQFNAAVGTNYPTDLEEFDTDTIVYLVNTNNRQLSMLFQRTFDVLKTYYTTDPKCAKPKMVTYHDPVAQTFIFFKDEYPFGCYLNSVTTFFRKKPDDGGQPINCYITETTNNIPTNASLAHAKTTLMPSGVNVSEAPCVHDTETGTTFEFPIPIYLKPDTLYSFVLQTNSDEYEVYTARLGDHPIPSTTKNFTDDSVVVNGRISKTPYIGELFKSQNMLTWTSEPNDDIMFTLNRCSFDTTQRPKIEFVVPKYMQQRKLGDHEIEFLSSDEANVAIGTGGTSNTPFIVDAFNVTTTDLTFTEAPINYSYRSTLTNYTKDLLETAITPGKYGSATFDEIMLDDGKGERMITPNTISDAYSFSLYADMYSTNEAISPMISEVGLSVFGVKYYINNLGISNSNIKIISGGTGYSNTGTIITLGRTSNTVIGNTVIGTPTILQPVVNATGSIVRVDVIQEGSDYASTPTINIIDSHRGGNSNASIIVNGETDSKGGNSILRYITKPVTLTQEFDAGDLRVYLTAYRPKRTNIYVYYKILDRNDNQLFDDSDWQIMTTISGSGTFAKKRGDLYEYVFAPYDLINPGIATNKVSYTSKFNNKTYNTFYQFAIKIVMSSPDPTFIPYVEDMRTIALVPIEL